jgi:DNA (cytosine-5)-methyltransferase 1
MTLGFQRSGFDVAAAFDNWKPALDVYRLNFDHPVIELDLNTEQALSAIRTFSPDVIVGGPPCQDFSIAGFREFEGKRANLTVRFAEIVTQIRPSFFLMENVYNIQKSPILDVVLKMFESSGYGLTHGVFDASLMGCPQRRKRYLVLGEYAGGDEGFRSLIESGLATRPMTVREYLGDQLRTDFYYMHPRSYARRAIFSIDEPSSTIRGVNRPMPEGYVFHPADAIKKRSKIRALTSAERAQLQTFPASFKFEGTRTSIEQMIGNAVPVRMAEFMAKVILKKIYGNH